MAEVWTIKRLLEWIAEYFAKQDIDAPRLSAEMLLAHVLGMRRIELYMHFDRVVEAGELARLRELVRRCGDHEPLAYLIGRAEFYSMELEITRACLIPRPETEQLVQRAVEYLRTRNGSQHVCDLCTGSGCAAVAIAKNFTEADVIATDISEEALEVAARNVARYELKDRVRLVAGDLFEPLIAELDKPEFDLITANPPYVTSEEYEQLERNVRDYEPRTALLAGKDGLDVYRRIVAEAPRFLKPGAALMMEIGYKQGPAIKKLLEDSGGYAQVNIEKDYSDHDRIAVAVTP